LTEHNLIDKRQYGFRQNHNLISHYNHL